MISQIFYFTGSGNSLVVARDLAQKLQVPLTSIPSVMRKNNIEITSNLIGIVFPVYFADLGGVPLIVEQFIKKLENLASKYIFVVCTHAGGPGRTIEYVRSLIQVQGGELAAGFTVEMSVPYSPKVKIRRSLFHKEINYRKEIAKDYKKQQELYRLWHQKLEIIIKNIRSRDKGIYEIKKSILKRLFPPLISLSKAMFRRHYKQLAKISSEDSELISDYTFENLIHFADKSFEVNDQCKGCGTCAQICPVNNIKIVKNKPEWQHRCENCYACYAWCPNKAIFGEIVAYNKNYHHPEVRISDMIDRI